MDDDKRIQAEAQVDAFLSIMAKRYNLDPDDIGVLADELVSLHRRGQRYEKYGEWFARAAITALGGGVVVGLGWVVVTFIRSVTGEVP